MRIHVHSDGLWYWACIIRYLHLLDVDMDCELETNDSESDNFE